MKQRIVIPREVLLMELERYCSSIQCNARTRIGLTKEDARAYCGFECERCGLWNDDFLTERDVPDWWEELAVTGLVSLRGQQSQEPDEPGEVIERLSEAYKHRDEE